jgi:hypothetical protein
MTAPYNGKSVAISPDGDRIIFGSPYACTGSSSTDKGTPLGGMARVYLRTDSLLNLEGKTMEGGNPFVHLGRAVAISRSGPNGHPFIATGEPGGSIYPSVGVAKVCTLKTDGRWGDFWSSVASLRGEAQGDSMGFSVALSTDGRWLVGGAPANDKNGKSAGYVEVLRFDNASEEYLPIGGKIYGRSAGNHFGWSVAISSASQRLAVGAPTEDVNGVDDGAVRIFELKNGVWVQLGNTINGISAGDQAGFSISFSEDGNRLAVGAPYNDNFAQDAGQTSVYDWVNGTWVQAGQSIDGDTTGGLSGWAVSLSPDGSSLAVGAPNSKKVGQARVFNWERNLWNLHISSLYGTKEKGQFGYSLALSDSGKSLLIGAPRAEEVRMYDLPRPSFIPELNPEPSELEELVVFPNPSDGLLTVNSSSAKIEDIQLVDIKGRSVKAEVRISQNQVLLSTNYRGLAIVKVQTENDVILKKVHFK